MSPLRSSIALFLCLASFGCFSQSLPARTYSLTMNADAVVLVEFIEKSGGGDCPRYDPDRVLSSRLQRLTAGAPLLIDKPVAHSDVYFLGIRFRSQHARWMIFQPGRVVTTVYPEGRDLRDLQHSPGELLQPTVGWRNRSITIPFRCEPMQPTWPPLKMSYPVKQREVPITLVLRDLETANGRLLDGNLELAPEPAFPTTLSAADAANLAEQLDTLIAFIDGGKGGPIRDDDAANITRAIDEEWTALDAGGLPEDRRAELAPRIDAIRARLRKDEPHRPAGAE